VSSEKEKPRGFLGRLFGGKVEKPIEPPAPDTSPAEPKPTVPAEPAITPQDKPEGPSALVDAAVVADEPPVAKNGWFQRLKSGLSKTSSKLSDGITSVFTKRKLDTATLDDLEDLLIQADLGLETAERIASTLKKTRYDKHILPDEVRQVLAAEVERVLVPLAVPLVVDPNRKPHVILFVGVNGTGKTTTIGKLASKYRSEGRKVMIAAGDTFRAAAVEQLKVWGERSGAPVIARSEGADAAGLVFDAMTEARLSGSDVLLIDTAGRLQNKAVLMEELQKIVRVIEKIDATAPHHVVLVLDATTGQNALNQVEVFKDKAGVTGLVMTKLDGTARGGILVAISAKFQLPVYAIGVGEGIDDLQPFDAGEFARAIALS
jgi:fused signal recognition particle receptor